MLKVTERSLGFLPSAGGLWVLWKWLDGWEGIFEVDGGIGYRCFGVRSVRIVGGK